MTSAHRSTEGVFLLVVCFGFASLLTVSLVVLLSISRNNDAPSALAVTLTMNRLFFRGGAMDAVTLWREGAHAGRDGRSQPDVLAGSLVRSILPRMIVLDLDATLWLPECFELPACPSIPVFGSLGVSDDGKNVGDGVVGLRVPGPDGPTVTLFPEARSVLLRLYEDPTFDGVLVGAASTSEEPEYSAALLDGLEVLPGVPIGDVFDYVEVGRTGKFTSRKTTHFRELHHQSNVPYNQMLFFDDCTWHNHVQDMLQTFGVIGVETPDGLTVEKFEEGLERFEKAAIKRSKP